MYFFVCNLIYCLFLCLKKMCTWGLTSHVSFLVRYCEIYIYFIGAVHLYFYLFVLFCFEHYKTFASIDLPMQFMFREEQSIVSSRYNKQVNKKLKIMCNKPRISPQLKKQALHYSILLQFILCSF